MYKNARSKDRKRSLKKWEIKKRNKKMDGCVVMQAMLVPMLISR